ncbi:MAG: SDR family NAD(P)-dependent oxidoreductase [Bacteroidales bacterium]|nr:SDR family NAD(P)-dependent oxidoreductase [Bacteroidales bacterium]MDD4670532.1 SDR family NAD(P)-dependent oxidoreductase [Bacteroidales bacterium]
MNILVTGCAGFIGSHISKRLAEEGHTVIGIDNLNEYYDVSLKIARLGEMAGNDKFSFIKLDLCDMSGMSALFDNYRFDVVCHLAAQAGVRYSFENPQAYIDSNITGFGNIISLSCKHHIPHFIYASSSSVYGKNSKVPFSENDHLEGQVSLYAETKRKNELEALRYSEESGLFCTGLRFFTVYGPWGRPDMAPMLFMDSIFKGKEIKVFNKGELWRDFTYIDDIVNVVEKVVTSGPDADAPYRIYNIGHSSPVYLNDFISILEEIIGIKAKKVPIPMQPGDVITTYADTTLIQNKFGIKPSTDIRTGIEKLWAWYRNFYKSRE